MSEEAREVETRDGAPVLAATLWVTVFSLVFAALALLPINVPVYIPLEHRWQLGFPPRPAVGMDFFGRVLYSLLAGALAAVLGWAIGRYLVKWKPGPDSQGVRMLAIYSFVSLALPFFIYCYVLLFK